MLANPSLEYFKILKKALPDEQAQLVAQAISEVQHQTYKEIREEIRTEFNVHELVTKKDLEIVKLELQKEIVEVKKEIAESRSQTLIWIFGMLVFFSSALLAVMAKGFHWV